MAKLVILTEGFAGTSYELKAERTTVGRHEDNAFVIPEPSVSGHHCEIILKGTEVVVRDLNSTNGTYINSQPISEGVLKPGQILRLGQVELRLEDGATPPPPKKPLAHTTALGAGVKLTELEQKGGRPVVPPFAKKSDAANRIFLVVGIVLGLVILGLIAYSVYRLSF
ncbi:MAG: FHA domain-containing protein [Verrucomicrobiae bacterium]|nr:FHA domain-containing protein [Verrucomicrobiae bacterium]